MKSIVGIMLEIEHEEQEDGYHLLRDRLKNYFKYEGKKLWEGKNFLGLGTWSILSEKRDGPKLKGVTIKAIWDEDVKNNITDSKD